MAQAIASYDSRDVASAPDPEARLEELGRAGGALRRVAAALARQLLDRRGCERLGFASVGDYARERLGVSGSSLGEWARVDRLLDELPQLEAALVAGALPWSKVRMLARFVTAEDEAGWIAHAAEASVRTLEREVRAVDRQALEMGGRDLDEDGRGIEATARVQIACSPAVALGWQRVKRIAAQVAGENVSSGTVLEMVTAETLSAFPLDGSAAEECEASTSSAAPDTGISPPPELRGEVESANADVELPPFLRSLVFGLTEADSFELDARLRRVIRLEQRLGACIGPLLRQVGSKEYEWKGKRWTLGAFARERLGMSPRKARALLRIERASEGCVELKAAYRDGTLSWLQAQILAPLLVDDEGPDGPWREAWVAVAGRVTVRRLEEIVEYALGLRRADPARWMRVCADPMCWVRSAEERQVCVEPMPADEGWSVTITAPIEVARLFRAAICSVRRAAEREAGALPDEGHAFEAMIAHALHAWGVDEPWLARKMRRLSPVFERDGWRCTVPGCSSRRNLHAHHIVFRSAGGGDEPANLTTVCAFHHQRGVHAGRIGIHGTAPDGLVFELGLREGQPPLARYRSGDVLG